MNDYRTQHYLTARGSNVLAIRLVNIDIGDGDHHQGKPPRECLSDQETDIEEEINKSIGGPAGNGKEREDKQIWLLEYSTFHIIYLLVFLMFFFLFMQDISEPVIYLKFLFL